MEGISADDAGAGAPLVKWRSDFSREFQNYLDRSTPHPVQRWLGTVAVFVVYVLRVYFAQGFYIVSYGLGIYVLNLLIGFLSPIVDPELEELDGASLPTRGSDEFKPFIRRLRSSTSVWVANLTVSVHEFFGVNFPERDTYKFFEERAALEAKYQKLYEPLYTKRYEIVNGVVEVEDVTTETTADDKSSEEKGVPDFWLTAMKTNEMLAEEVRGKIIISFGLCYLYYVVCLNMFTLYNGEFQHRRLVLRSECRQGPGCLSVVCTVRGELGGGASA